MGGRDGAGAGVNDRAVATTSAAGPRARRAAPSGRPPDPAARRSRWDRSARGERTPRTHRTRYPSGRGVGVLGWGPATRTVVALPWARATDPLPRPHGGGVRPDAGHGAVPRPRTRCVGWTDRRGGAGGRVRPASGLAGGVRGTRRPTAAALTSAVEGARSGPGCAADRVVGVSAVAIERLFATLSTVWPGRPQVDRARWNCRWGRLPSVLRSLVPARPDQNQHR